MCRRVIEVRNAVASASLNVDHTDLRARCSKMAMDGERRIPGEDATVPQITASFIGSIAFNASHHSAQNQLPFAAAQTASFLFCAPFVRCPSVAAVQRSRFSTTGAASLMT